MNVLLINPNREQMPWPAIPVGLCLVATALEHAGHEVDLLDLTFSRAPGDDTRAAVRRRQPDVVGLGVRNIDNCNFEHPVFYLEEIRDEVVRAVREAAPRARLVIGGAGANVAAWDVMRFLDADVALVGDGEIAMPELLEALEAGRDPTTVRGALVAGGPSPIVDTAPSFGHDRVFAHEPPTGRAFAADLDAVPTSDAWRWVDVARYASHGAPYSIQTKRGCALRCSYCVYNNIEGRKYRLRRPSAIVDEIEEVVGGHGVRHVDFVDSTFNLPLAHTLELCDELASRAPGPKLSTMGLNPAATTPELLRAMRRAGFDNVMCTPESASNVTLASLQKGYGRDAVVRAASHLRDAGMKTFWFFMFGAPGETIDTVRETLDFCEQHVPPTDMVLFTTGIRVHPGTPLEKHLKETGWFAHDDPLLQPSWYVSPTVDLHALYGLLVRAAERHPNWMTNAETVVSPRIAGLVKRGLHAAGVRDPFWTHLPRLFSLTTKIGFRRHDLSQQRDRVLSDPEVRHRQPR
jgi:radical SAM superfamily enzyme YgiQ (UPF0313 family)